MPEELGAGPYTLPELTDYFRKGLEALEQMQGAAPEGDMLAEEALGEVIPEAAALDEAALMEEPMPGGEMDIGALLEAEAGAEEGPPMMEEEMDLDALTANAARNALA